MNFQPGQKVAHQMPHRPDLMVLGKVQPDGKNVLWQEIVDGHGTPTKANGASGVRAGRPVPLQGDEQPCPAQFQQYVH